MMILLSIKFSLAINYLNVSSNTTSSSPICTYKLGDGYARGQGFKIPSSTYTYITGVEFLIKSTTGVPQSIKLRIVGDSTGNPNYNDVKAEKNITLANIKNDTFNSFMFSEPFTQLTFGTQYHIVFYEGSGAGTYYTFCVNANEYVNGSESYVTNAQIATPGSWTQESGADVFVHWIYADSNTSTPTNASLASYNVTNLQNPEDINSSTYSVNINTSILNLTTSQITNSSFTTIQYRPFTYLNNGCSIFYQKTCHQYSSTYSNTTMNKVNNTFYNITLDDGEILPAYYPYDWDFIRINLHNNYTSYNNNNIKFNVFNFSTLTNFSYLMLEMDAVNISSSTASMLIYYCNSSYTTGNPLTNGNCELIQTYLPQSWGHLHNLSGHGLVRFQINSVTKTQTSSFIFVSPNLLSSNGWRFGYVTNISYDNTSFNNGNYNAWSNTNFIYDIHYHSYLPQDYFEYKTYFFDGANSSNTSIIKYDFFNITQSPPTIPQILTNCSMKYPKDINGVYDTMINVNWTKSSDVNNDSIIYTTRFYYNNYTLFCENNLNNNCSVNTSQLNNVDYTLSINTCDSFNNCVVTDNTCIIDICVSSWEQIFQPCISGASLIIYEDSNDCGNYWNLPGTNNTYEECLIPITEGETNLVNSIYVLILVIVISMLFYVYKKKM